MRCQDIERLIIGAGEEALASEDKKILDEHIAGCVACSRFQQDLEGIRKSVRILPAPPLPAALDQRTRNLCRAAARGILPPAVAGGAVPRLIQAAVALLLVLTVILLIPYVTELKLDETLSLANALALTMILQNAAMLILAPVLIRRFRLKQQDLRMKGIHNG